MSASEWASNASRLMKCCVARKLGLSWDLKDDIWSLEKRGHTYGDTFIGLFRKADCRHRLPRSRIVRPKGVAPDAQTKQTP